MSRRANLLLLQTALARFAGRPAPELKGIEWSAAHFVAGFEFKDMGDDLGTIEGYGATFNGLDRVADTILPGAFKGSLADWRQRKQKVPMLWQHNPDKPIGVWDELVEDEKGLRVKGQLLMQLPAARDARTLIKAGALGGLSIGYEVTDKDVSREGVRRLKKIDLWEISPVTFPADRNAKMTAKSELSVEEIRQLERDLRTDAGLSGAQAVKAIALLKKHLRDGGGELPLEDDRDGVKADWLMSLRRMTQTLGGEAE